MFGDKWQRDKNLGFVLPATYLSNIVKVLKKRQQIVIKTHILLCTGEVWTSIETGRSFKFCVTIESSEATIHEFKETDQFAA